VPFQKEVILAPYEWMVWEVRWKGIKEQKL
jgi:hypothetical protein